MSTQTTTIDEAATAARRHPVVRDARVVENERTGRVLELVLITGIDRVPPGVLLLLGEHDCGISAVQPQERDLIVEVR